MQTIALIDYGSGNLHSAAKAFERAAREAERDVRIAVTSDAGLVKSADRIVLPGVGAFADCKAGLQAEAGLLGAITEVVRDQGRPFLGICVGMQLLATRGLEFGETSGFDLIPGTVKALEPNDAALKIPHMGWNTLSRAHAHPLLSGIETGPQGWHAYFVHSYHLEPANPAHLIAETAYGGAVTAMVAADNIAGTQFHPEKSQTLGLKLIANFLSWQP